MGMIFTFFKAFFFIFGALFLFVVALFAWGVYTTEVTDPELLRRMNK